MKKKMLLAGLITGLAVTVTGCGSNNYTLTTEQNDQVAEYIANVMLERSFDNSWKYRKAKNSLASSNVSNTLSSNSASSGSANTMGGSTGGLNAGNANSTVGGNTSQSTDPLSVLSKKLDLTGASITYKTYSVGDRYPTGEYVICVPANPGYKILAVEFNIQNQSGADLVVNSKKSDISVKLTNSGETLTQETTILKNDISQLNDVTIGVGETYPVVAIFQVKEEQSEKLTNKLSAEIFAGGTSLGTVSIK